MRYVSFVLVFPIFNSSCCRSSTGRMQRKFGVTPEALYYGRLDFSMAAGFHQAARFPRQPGRAAGCWVEEVLVWFSWVSWVMSWEMSSTTSEMGMA